jgi:hypothetical protein
MDIFYIILFSFFAVLAALLEWSQNSQGGGGGHGHGVGNSKAVESPKGAAVDGKEGGSDGVSANCSYLSFRTNYVIVFSLMMAGDWLQVGWTTSASASAWMWRATSL